MDLREFRDEARKMVDYVTDYLDNIESYPVKSQVSPREIFDQLPDHPPAAGEGMAEIMKDFDRIIMPGVTHWQSPNFYAYFNANNSYPSLLAEMLTSAIGAQCMIWDTSPAAAELEEMMMNWLASAIGIPDEWDGVIHDTASTSTLVALLCAREQVTSYSINENGFDGRRYRVYCSDETHSSIEKGVKIAGFGRNNLVKVGVDSELALDPEELESAIMKDIQEGYVPVCVIASIGTTGTTAIDPLADIARICEKHNVWLHVDAAYAGSALMLDENKWMLEGIETADSFVFNPHKWLFTNFDCTAYFVKDKGALIRTFEILPEYLKTGNEGEVNNYRDWGIQLGRRFRALKLWFVLRSFGINELKAKIRHHIELARLFASWVEEHPDFEVVAPVPFATVCFRYVGGFVNE